MLDLLYVVLTIAFFALMLWYVNGCASLGHSTMERDEERQP